MKNIFEKNKIGNSQPYKHFNFSIVKKDFRTEGVTTSDTSSVEPALENFCFSLFPAPM